MEIDILWQRRDFLKSAGLGFLACLAPRQAAALAGAELVLASAAKKSDGGFAATLLSEQGQIIAEIDLPGRGHDVTQCPVTKSLVVFARRPGTFALVFDAEGRSLEMITSITGRHFYGHGVFSVDGKLLYATENDFENALGIIGIYDARQGFARIGEFKSGGVGPHDVLLSDDGKYLCVANGGIETHPDFGREKLNLASMQPNIVWIDCAHGDVVAHHKLPPELHQLSLRHLARGPGQSFWFGAQYQGEKSAAVPLIGRVGLDDALSFIALDDDRDRFDNYIGSVASSHDGTQVIATSPVGNVALIFDSVTQQKILIEQENVCGVDWALNAPLFSTGNGVITRGKGDGVKTRFGFDNHLVALR